MAHTTRLFCLFALLMASFPSYAQLSLLDSLNSALENTENDTLRANLLAHIAFEMGLNDNRGALIKAREALEYSKEIMFQRGILNAHKTLGRLYYEKGELDSAMIYYSMALQEYEKLGEKRVMASIYRDIGQVHVERKQFDDAEVYYQKVLQIATEFDEPRMLGNANNGLGSMYLTRGFSFEKADSLLSRQYFAKAGPYFEKAIAYFTNDGYERGVALANGNLGILAMNIGEFKKSLDYSAKALDYFITTGEKVYQAISYDRISETYIKLNDLRKAREYAEKVLAIGLEMESHFQTRDAYARLAKIAEEEGSYAESLEYYKLLIDYNNKIINEESQNKINELEQEYRANERELEIAKLNSEKELQAAHINRQHIILSFSILTLLFTAVMSFLLYRSVRSKTRANDLLSLKNIEIEKKSELLAVQNRTIIEQNEEINQKNEKLRELYEEHRSLMLMVAHDLQSPFNKIKGLSTVLSISGKLSAEQQDILDKIDQVSETGRQLVADITNVSYFESENLSAKLKAFRLNYLLKKIQQEHESYANKKKIQLVLKELPEDKVIETDRDFFTRIMDNLISNAIKYSPANKKVYINPGLESEYFSIEVKDEGPGLSEDDKKNLFKKFQRLSARPTGGENSTGLGLNIVKTLVQKLNGDIKVESNLGKGSSFVVTFPAGRRSSKSELDMFYQ